MRHLKHQQPKSSEDIKRGMISLYLAVLMLSGTGLFSKLISLSAAHIILFRCLIAFVSLWLAAIVMKQSLAFHRKKDIAILAGLGALMAFHWATYYHAVKVSTVAVGMISIYTYPVMTAIMEPFLFKERVKKVRYSHGGRGINGYLFDGAGVFFFSFSLSRRLLGGVISSYIFSPKYLF